jgi:multiple sugar transport system permease protein
VKDLNWLKQASITLNKPKNAAYMFVLPAFLIIVVFNIVPLFSSLVISTLNITTYFTNVKFVGLNNYIRALKDANFLNSWKVTLLFTVFDVPVSLLFTMFVSALIQRTNFSNKFFRSIYILPLICSSTVVGLMWNLFLNPNVGWGTYFLQTLGLPKMAIFSDVRLAIYGIIFISIWRGFGVSTMILVPAMQGINNDLYEAADLDGATKWNQFWNVTVPGVISTLFFLIITRIIGSFQVFDLIYVITNGGPANSTRSVVNYIFNKAFSTDFKLGYSTAMSEILFVVIMAITIFMYARMLKSEKSVEG